MINVDVDTSKIQAELNRLLQKAGNPSPALLEIGEYLTESTKQRFGTQTGPDGQHWLDNSTVTIERKGRNQPLTGETGKLQDEIHYNLTGHDTLEIGSPMEYAAMQQFGGTKDEFPHLWGDIPARPFLGISEQDSDHILDILAHHLKI